MLAKDLRAGDEYRDENGLVQITIRTDATSAGFSPANGARQVHVGVEHADGGHSPRWFDAEAEVPYVRL